MWLGSDRWQPSRGAPGVLRYSSFLVLGVAFFSFAGVGLPGFLGVRCVLRVLFHEGLAA